MKDNVSRKIKSFLGSNANMRAYTMNGILFTIVTIFSRTYAPKFMDRLGAGSLHYSLFNSLPGLVAVLTTIPGILYIQNASDKGLLMRRFFYLSRFFPILLMATPFLPVSIRGYAFVVLFSLMNLPESIGQTALQSWTGSIFHPQDIANALSQRNKLSQVTTIVLSALVGIILSLPPSGDNDGVIRLYQVLFLASVIFGIYEIKTLRKIKEVSRPAAPKTLKLGKSITSIFHHREFVLFLICSLLFHFSWQMGWPLFNLYQIEYLKADEKWLALINVSNALAMVLAYNLWSWLIRIKGYKLTTAIAVLGMALSPAAYALTHTLALLTVMNILIGIFVAGITVVILGSLLESAPADEVMLCTAVHQTLINITLFVSPFVSELILRSHGIYTALYVTSAARLLSAVAFFLRWYLTRERSPKQRIAADR
ncbi:MFS transporter [Proteiniclasticum sp. QWL-01]|uniref:MFS transporter n=1 Tax=Proteiniclasticum sp. QWL-01 TaxID=3036945 RepID=UPI00240FEC0F|nr:MFS transporter [Proteiniclasticum sp. QWL-01]WFF72038.1 MFS transporter [Proteiniclasticum sp. QWL-01]